MIKIFQIVETRSIGSRSKFFQRNECQENIFSNPDDHRGHKHVGLLIEQRCQKHQGSYFPLLLDESMVSEPEWGLLTLLLTYMCVYKGNAVFDSDQDKASKARALWVNRGPEQKPEQNIKMLHFLLRKSGFHDVTK